VCLNLEGQYPDKSKLIIEYTDDLKEFSVEELRDGVERNSVCSIYLYSNVKHPVKICISDKNQKGPQFCLVDERGGVEIPFSLFKSLDHSYVKNGAEVFSRFTMVEPVDVTFSIGVSIPCLKKYKRLSNKLSSKFTITLKHVG
jgi:hypothetical protein